MCKLVVGGFKFILFLWLFALSTADKYPWDKNTTFTIRQSSYVLYKEWATWHEAKERCSTAGAQLLVPLDEAEAKAVMGVVADPDESWMEIWTDINDLHKPGVFRTSDGRPVSLVYHRWVGDELESEGVARHCARLLMNALLASHSCNWTLPYVCKFPDKHETHDNRVFITLQNSYMFHKTLATWREASERCVASGAQLWAPADEAEQRAVRGEVNRDHIHLIWSGINNIYTDMVYRAPDGWPLNVAHQRWYPGLSYTLSWRCTTLDSESLLRHADCNSVNFYLCQFSAARKLTNIKPIQPNETAFRIETNDGRKYVYEYLNQFATWEQARDSCSGAGAQLLVPEDEAEARAVRWKVHLTLANSGMWTGINDLAMTGGYRTLDGRNLSAVHNRWADSDSQQDLEISSPRCVQLKPDSSLNEIYCVNVRAFVCKFPAASELIAHTSKASPALTLHATALPTDAINVLTNKTFTIKMNGKDFQYEFHNEAVTWNQARERCAAAGAQLLAAVSDTEARLVRGEVYYDIPSTLIWTAIKDANYNEVYEVPNDQPVNKTHYRWAPGEPNSWSGSRRCVALWSNTALFSVDCAWTYPYVCTSPTHLYDKTITIKANGTDIQYDYHNEWVSWQQASHDCSAVGAQLWAPGGKAEARAVISQVNAFPEDCSIWTAINASGDYQTIDGDARRKATQDDGKPASDGDSRRCVLLIYDKIMYNSSLVVSYCTKKKAYVCKFPAGSERRSPGPTAPTAEPDDATTPHCVGANKLCDKTFTVTTSDHEIRYALHMKFVTWHEARKRCSGAGATLLVAEDAGEAQAVMDQVTGRYWIWTGINDLETSGVYKTLDGRNISAVHQEWHGYKPDSRGGEHHCVLMGPSSLLKVGGCDWVAAYVCKLPATSPRVTLPSQPINVTTPQRDKDRTFTVETNGTDIKYELHVRDVQWHEARARCSGAGATLLVAEDAGEARAVMDQVAHFSSINVIWIGITDLNTSNVYQTVDGRNINAVHHTWVRSRPDSQGGERHCVVMWSTTKLYLAGCDMHLPYVCKFLALPPRPDNATTPSSGLATTPAIENPAKQNDHTFTMRSNGVVMRYVFNDTWATWHEAWQLCSAAGALLWSPGDWEETRAVRGGFSRENPDGERPIWTGINDLDASGFYQTLDGRSISADHHMWGVHEPDSRNGILRCALFQTDKLFLGFCHLTAPYICQFTAVSEGASSTPYEPCGSCSRLEKTQNLIKSSYEYSAETDTWMKLYRDPATWNDAYHQCKQDGGQLASPISNKFLKDMRRIMKSKNTFFGILTGINNNLTPGYFSSVEGISLENITAQWNEGQRPQKLRDWIVLEMTGKLKSVSRDGAYPYICYQKSINEEDTEKNCVCSGGYKKYNQTSSYYKLHEVAKNWSEAVFTCAREGAHLVVLDEASEPNELKQILNMNHVHIAWIALTELGVLRKWLTVYGQTINEAGNVAWVPGKSHHSEKVELCGAMLQSGLIDPNNCSLKKNFLCETKVNENINERLGQ